MSSAKLRSIFLQRSNAEVNEEYNYVSNPVFQITTKDLSDSKKASGVPHPKDIKTANWFIPYFTHAAYGGAYTMLRFVDYFQSQGVNNRIIIYDRDPKDAEIMRAMMRKTFPKLEECELIMFAGDASKLKDLPECDIAICTSWQSAYFLLKFNKTKRKYYFAMDYEPLFYPAGAIYALAESTYRFPFRAIVNTPGLLAAINQRHGTEGISYTPAVDRQVYHPKSEEENKRNNPIRIFFYTRPNNLRNSFTLMIGIMKILKEKYGNKVEIVTAGAEWDERHYGLKGLVTNVGLLHSLEEVAALYRTCDVGIIYMLTKHPSYQPFEYMASGMATVTNNNEDNLWLLKHEENCLVAEPSAAAMAEQIERLVDDENLRQKIVKNGLKTVENEWDWQTDIIWNDIKHN
jgi:glycosyltransferase involved in cell wall biosynthesis